MEKSPNDTVDLTSLSDSFTEEDELELIEKSRALQDCKEPEPEHLEVLQRCFGHKSFRPMQWKIISSVINDRRDNCVVMATGYGKSLCYQYPSVFCGGITLVITPLISLMEDQVLSLKMLNVPACLLGSAQTQQKKVIEEILDNKYSLVYLTPEFCCGDMGNMLLKDIDSRLSIMLIAIDEAHCVSTWGHDFRHQYRQLGTIKLLLPHVPILAVTATATPRVRADIVSSLRLKDPQVLCSGFDRPNLYFSVFLKGNMGILSDLRKAMVKQNGEWVFAGSTIIYCITRKQTEDVATLLQGQGIKCSAYHAGLSLKERKEAHEKFVRDKINVIVATIAFGMGIDKPDVRCIVHYGASRDIESYYQEVGRAGRDGQPAKCITFYNSGDFTLHKSLREMGYSSEKTKEQKEGMARLMQKYLELRTCRRVFILNHFEGQSGGNKKTRNNCCDNCTKIVYHVVPEKYEGMNEQGLYDFTQDVHIFLAAVRAMGGTAGIGKYILFLRGSNSSKIYERLRRLPLYGSGKHKSENWWKCIANILVNEKYLKKSLAPKRTGQNFAGCTVSVGEKGERFLTDIIKQSNSTKILLEPNPEVRRLLKQKSPPDVILAPTIINKSVHSEESQTKDSTVVVEDETQKEARMALYRLLLNKRTELAYGLDCMPYMIASNEALMKMAELKPRNIAQLRNCRLDGFTEAKLTKFGDDFINIIPVQQQSISDKQSLIEDICHKHPLPNVTMTTTVETSYNLFASGISVQDIANRRGSVRSTITSHLSTCIKVGKPIQLKDLEITDDVKNKIVKVIRGPRVKSNVTDVKLIKDACPEDITYEQIKPVAAYLQIRDHLKQFNCDYDDYEEPVAEEVTDEREDESEEINDALNAMVEELEKNGYLEETFIEETTTSSKSSSDEPPEKKKRFSKLSLLDSPPRRFI